jgi:hypothetical protein
MEINWQTNSSNTIMDFICEEHHSYLLSINYYRVDDDFGIFRGKIDDEFAPAPDYYAIDLVGDRLKYANEHFPKDKFTWYLHFESVFAVPENMYSALLLKWQK